MPLFFRYCTGINILPILYTVEQVSQTGLWWVEKSITFMEAGLSCTSEPYLSIKLKDHQVSTIKINSFCTCGGKGLLSILVIP